MGLGEYRWWFTIECQRRACAMRQLQSSGQVHREQRIQFSSSWPLIGYSILSLLLLLLLKSYHSRCLLVSVAEPPWKHRKKLLFFAGRIRTHSFSAKNSAAQLCGNLLNGTKYFRKPTAINRFSWSFSSFLFFSLFTKSFSQERRLHKYSVEKDTWILFLY